MNADCSTPITEAYIQFRVQNCVGDTPSFLFSIESIFERKSSAFPFTPAKSNGLRIRTNQVRSKVDTPVDKNEGVYHVQHIETVIEVLRWQSWFV